MKIFKVAYLAIVLVSVMFYACADEAQSIAAQAVNVRTAEQTRTDFESMAMQLPFLDKSAVLYDRRRLFYDVADPAQEKLHWEILDRISAPEYSTPNLQLLLAHPEPKVRTLALVALFDREEPSLLPDFVNLAGDESRTFDGHPELSKAKDGLLMNGVGPSPLEQTVGGFASEMVDFYFRGSGLKYGKRYQTQYSFDGYWKAREKRKHTAGWFAVQLARASQSTSPTQSETVPRIRALRARIDRLPADDRAWMLLWLRSQTGGDVLASEIELLEAARGLGPDKLLQMLQGKISTDDPDLQSHETAQQYRSMGIWVLQHAILLLRAEQATQLLEINDRALEPWLAIAASTLQPQHAKAWLYAEFDRSQRESYGAKRAEIAAALWRLNGTLEVSFLVNWFYSEPTKPNVHTDAPSWFLDAVRKKPRLQEKYLIAALLRDPRLETLTFDQVKALVEMVNPWLPEPIVDLQTMYQNRHGLGEVEDIKQWKAKLRASLPVWSPTD